MARKRLPAAAALKYDPKRNVAPQVVASGQGRIAERILEVAREANVPVVEDDDPTIYLVDESLVVRREDDGRTESVHLEKEIDDLLLAPAIIEVGDGAHQLFLAASTSLWRSGRDCLQRWQ